MFMYKYGGCLMNWHQLSGRIVGLYYIAFGTFTLYVLSMAIGQIIFEDTRMLLPTFQMSSIGYSFLASNLSLIIQLVLLIPAGIMLAWKLKRWAAIFGIVGILVPSLISLALGVFVSAAGGPPITKLIRMEVLALSWGLFAGLPILGIVSAWRDLH